jgi:ElaB/YqjD/DUF883 family membrane-anchored ribosome-binding protein
MADELLRAPAAKRDPATVRAELARTRARMSATIGEIEEVLLDKKDVIVSTAKGIRDRLDPFYKARQHPMAAIGIVFGAGLLVGVLTGGKKRIPPPIVLPPPSDVWERRARRLLRIARGQREELETLREQTSGWEEADYYEADDVDDDYDEDYYSPDEEIDDD